MEALMKNAIIFQIVIPFGYLIIILFLKKNVLDKKYDYKKSTMIADIFNSLVLLYFLLLKDMLMTLMFTFYFMSRYNSYRKKNNVKNKNI